MKMPSVMGHKFSEVPRAEIQRSAFDRSFGLKTTFDAGWLIPIYVDEALPGDTFVMNMNGFARLATPLKPFMDNLFMETFFFAIPVRLVWNNWQKFNGEQTDPGDSTDFVIPQMSPTPASGGYTVHSLADYFGLPINVEAISHSSLWHRAYNLVFNDWFRDQNLIDSLVVDKDDGPDDPADYVPKKRGKRHDYFTSALPWPQKGDSVVLPLGSYAPVFSDVELGVPGGVGRPFWQNLGSSPTVEDGALQAAATADEPNVKITSPTGSWGVGSNLYWQQGNGVGGSTGLAADLSTATAATINELRQAFQVQKLLERDARGGTRYTEIIRAHFGVTSPDARLQRPEYLGGGSSPVMISPVAQTSASPAVPTENDAQGNLAAIGTASWRGHGFAKSFTEHCLLLGLVNVRADLTYQQGIPRQFLRSTRYDFYWPALSHIGEQAIASREIYADGTAGDDDVFGYQERYAEYRYKPSQITGKFRSTFSTPLDMWHLAQEFGSRPELNETFITDDPPIDRVIAVPTEPHFLFDAYFRLKCARPMPVYGVPGLIDHF